MSLRNQHKMAPRGQALVEVIVTTTLLLSCLTVLAWGQAWVAHQAQSAESLRLHAEWCRQSLARCQSDTFAAMLSSQSQLVSHSVEQQHANALTQREWSSSLREVASLGGQAVFDLPNGNPLTVVAATTRPRVKEQRIALNSETLKLAVIPHDWRSVTRQTAAERIRRGSEPLGPMAAAVEAAHAPSLSVLMPVTDFLGLDTRTESVRGRFHRLDPLSQVQALGEPLP